VSAAVSTPAVSASTVESAPTVKSTASVPVEAAAASHRATAISATHITAAICSMDIAASIPTNVAAPITPAWATPITRTSPISGMTPTPVIPGSGTNKDAANEPPRAVETIRRTGIRIIGIVPIGAYRRSASITRSGIALIRITPVWIALIRWALIAWALIGRSLILTLVLLALILTLILLALVRVTRVVPSSRIGLRVRVSHRQCQRREQCKMLYVSHLTPLCQTRQKSDP